MYQLSHMLLLCLSLPSTSTGLSSPFAKRFISNSVIHLPRALAAPCESAIAPAHQPLAPRSSTKAFKLASTFAPIPAKLVKKIQMLQYIDMRELLPDITLLRHMKALDLFSPQFSRLC